jgi:polysaccharide deacetylase family protein (PEP-CTERM system associated)
MAVREKPFGMTNAFTVDVEDYYHVTAFEDCAPRERWDEFPSRVEANTRRVLAILERHQVRGTFFVLGWVGERFPALVREIAAAGHEIACHSYWHRLIYRMTPAEFREDLRRARDVLQDAVGTPVVAFRAPSYSITTRSLWALDILGEEGFRYDSSVFPVHHDRYGIPGAQRFPHQIGGSSLMEFPPSVLRLARFNVPVAGGGYFRLYPAAFTIRSVRHLNARLGQPFMFYIHPWELDPNQPRMPAPWRRRFRHYLNLASTERKLDRLLTKVRFGSMTEALNDHRPPGPRPAEAIDSPRAGGLS